MYLSGKVCLAGLDVADLVCAALSRTDASIASLGQTCAGICTVVGFKRLLARKLLVGGSFVHIPERRELCSGGAVASRAFGGQKSGLLSEARLRQGRVRTGSPSSEWERLDHHFGGWRGEMGADVLALLPRPRCAPRDFFGSGICCSCKLTLQIAFWCAVLVSSKFTVHA